MTEIVLIDRDAGPARASLERCVASGGVAVFPADGLYGLACDPLNPSAIGRIDEIKGRDNRKPSAVMYFSPLAMREIVESLGPRTREAIAALMPGPVTLVVSNPGLRYPLACREDAERLGLRLIEGPLAGAMSPIFQTSANRSGRSAPARYEQIPEAIVEAADLAIDGGVLTGLPSTVVDVTRLEQQGRAEWSVLREGGLPAAEVARRLSDS